MSRMSVFFTPRAEAALNATAERAGESLTATVNRAVQLYAQIAEMAEHEGVYRVTVPDFDERPLYLKVSRQPWRKWLPW